MRGKTEMVMRGSHIFGGVFYEYARKKRRKRKFHSIKSLIEADSSELLNFSCHLWNVSKATDISEKKLERT